MQVWTKNTKFIAILQIFSETGKLNSKATKKALNCTASIAADSIVDAISFITGVLFCDPKTSSNPAWSGSGRIWKSQIRVQKNPGVFKKAQPGWVFWILSGFIGFWVLLVFLDAQCQRLSK